MSYYKVVNSRGKEIFTDVTLHPGEILQMELAARNIKKTEFAGLLGMKPALMKEFDKRYTNWEKARNKNELYHPAPC